MIPDPDSASKPVVILRASRAGRKKRGGQSSAGPVLTFLGVVGIGAGAWWLMQPKPVPPEAPAEVSEEMAETTSGPPPTAEPAPAVAVTPVPAVVPAGEIPAEPVAPPEPTPEMAIPAPNKFERLLVLDDMGGAKKENLAWSDEAWDLVRKTGEWEDYQDLLARSLRAVARDKPDAGAVMAGKYSGPALVRYGFLNAVSGSDLRALQAEEEVAGHLRWLLETPEAMQAFAMQVRPEDSVRKALGLWARIAAEDASARKEYLELAVACALVFDREVNAGTGSERKAVAPVERFEWFRTQSEAGRLSGKVNRMKAAELVWVVGVPVSSSELEWALKEADFRQKSWGQAYGSIKYDMEKAVNGKNRYQSYTFAEIQKEGGICSDQAYFAAWTACAHGIPAMIISGDGARGPHAWMTWMADDAEWKFSGRFAGYPAGKCRSPQTGRSISEEEFLRLSDKKAADPARRSRAWQSLELAAAFAPEPDMALLCLTEAVKAAPRLAEPSAALLAFWREHRGETEVSEWKTFLRDLRKDFRDSESLMELASEAEQEFIFARQEAGETMKNLKREAKKVDDTSGGGRGMAANLDRLTASFKSQAEVLKQADNTDGIRSIYRRALSEHGDDAATFKALCRDFFSYMKDDGELAAKACRDLESACRRYVGRGKGDWFDVTSQNSAWREVAKCYRSAGDAKKADLILRDCDAREKAAKKKAV